MLFECFHWRQTSVFFIWPKCLWGNQSNFCKAAQVVADRELVNIHRSALGVPTDITLSLSHFFDSCGKKSRISI